MTEESKTEIQQSKNENILKIEIPEGYEEIFEILYNYELPDEGVVETKGNVITYENGYRFNKNTKMVESRNHYSENGPAESIQDLRDTDDK